MSTKSSLSITKKHYIWRDYGFPTAMACALYSVSLLAPGIFGQDNFAVLFLSLLCLALSLFWRVLSHEDRGGVYIVMLSIGDIAAVALAQIGINGLKPTDYPREWIEIATKCLPGLLCALLCFGLNREMETYLNKKALQTCQSKEISSLLSYSFTRILKFVRR